MSSLRIQFVLISLTIAAVSSASAINFLSDHFIQEINRKAKTWTAGRNFHPHTSEKYLKKVNGVLPDKEENMLTKKVYPLHILKDLPEEFDARIAWPECPTISDIWDQSNCGSCWAMASAEVMSDRTCIQTNATVKFRFSAQDLVSCCSFCGFGCGGGWISSAFQYWQEYGVVSGGPYNSSEGCMPYEIAPCDQSSCGDVVDTPACAHQCQAGYAVDYEHDKHKASKVYSVDTQENSIMYEIMNFGPVTTKFRVFQDFMHYKSGVYQHVSGFYTGSHAVKILGWGVENGVKYWLCANSWGTEWGENGYFKILKGSDECGIEEAIMGGTV